MKTLALFLLAVFGVLVVWMLIERQILRTRRQCVALKSLPSAFEGLRIVQVSDLHHRQMGRCNARIVRRIRELRPDLVVITGDLVSRDMRQFSETETFLRGLRQICPVYLCPGNHELNLPPESRAELECVIAGADCQMLSDETTALFPERGGQTLFLAGAQLKENIYKDENFRFRNLADYTTADLEQALGKRRGTTILLAHNPLFADSYAQWGTDLVLCGHLHGGVVRLPFVGGILSPERRFFPRYDKGYYRIGETQMIVSGGIGKPRLWNPPEVGVVELTGDDLE